jgi:autotransporter-associated beta strand protein
LGINVGINGGRPQPYLFDTGSTLFNAAYNPKTWGGFSEQQSVPLSPFPSGNNVTYCYGSTGPSCSTASVVGNLVRVQSLTFPGTTPGASITLAANPGYVVNALSKFTVTQGQSFSFPSYFTNNSAPFQDGNFFGVFGAGNLTLWGTAPTGIAPPGGVLGQTMVSGVTQGYVVAANGQVNPASSINPPQNVNGIDVTVGGRTQAVTACSPCVTVGLTPQVIGQFAAVGLPGATGSVGTLPVAPGGPFNNPYGGVTGNNGAFDAGAKFTVSLTPKGASTPAVTGTVRTVLDSGTRDVVLTNALFDPAVATGGGVARDGVTLSATGATPGGASAPGLGTSTAVLTKTLSLDTYNATFSGDINIIGISFFLQNSVLFDLSDNAIGYTPFFVSDANLATTANGPLVVDGTNIPIGLAGVISGPGGVTVNNGGALQLSATNTYTGPTTINAGGQLLIAGPGSIAASSGVTNNGLLDISRAWQPVGIQALSGAGQVNLGGQNLTIANGNGGVFSGSIVDGGYWPGSGGSLTIAGGTQVLSGINTYTGGTSIAGGTLVLTGSVASSVSVSANGILAGNGAIGASLLNNGTVMPGLLAPLTVAGNYTQGAGGVFGVAVNGAGQSDKLAIGGGAAIQNGSTVLALPQAGIYAPRTTYAILTAAGGVSGSYASALSSSPFLLPSLSYDANDVYLTLRIGGFAAAAQNPTQYAVGAALDQGAVGATGDFATVLGNLAAGNPAQVPAILASLSGMNYSGFANSMVQTAQLFMSNFLDQVGGANRRKTKVALAEACDVTCDASAAPTWGAWGGGLGGLGTVGSGSSLGGVTYNVGGFAAGLDRRFTDNFLAGITVGYTTGSQWVSGFTGQGFSNTVQAGVYGSFAEGPVYLDGMVGYAYSANQLNRSINIPGLAGRTAIGQAGANQVFGEVETGYRVDLGGNADAFLTPFARFQGYTGTEGAITESGAQSLSLNVAAETTSSLRTVLGAQLGGAMQTGWQDKLHAQLRLGWSHEYADTSRPVSVSLVGAPGAPFTTFGASPTRDGVVVGVSAYTGVADATSLYLRYEGNIAGQDSSHALTAGVRMTW